MATYKSEEVTLRTSAENVFGKISNLENLGELIKGLPAESVPAENREMLEKISVTPDTISFPGGPVGMVTLRKSSEEAPVYLRMEGENTPVPLSLSVRIRPVLAEECTVQVEFDLAIPAMLKPMVNGPMQQMTDQFAKMLRSIPMG